MGEEIKSVSLDFPNSAEDQIYYEVGKVPLSGAMCKPVTSIKKVGNWRLADRPTYIEIYTEDGLVAEMHQFGHIRYFEEE